MNLEKWKKFFHDAGIPSSDASTYAFKFANNRIQTDMLVDLNKDYLKEMGITIMGDVITILRHAKQVYEDIQKTTKTVLLEEPKDKKKEKELPAKVPKKSPAEPTATKISDISKTVSKLTIKRKSESPIVPAKKTNCDLLSKKAKVMINDDNIEECEDLGYVMIDSSKKSILFNQKFPKKVETHLKTLRLEKPGKVQDLETQLFHMSEDDDDDNVEVIINDPIVTPFAGYKKFSSLEMNGSRSKESTKGTNNQDSSKRTVFKRLGEEISQHSVTSTTPFEEDDQLSLSSKKLREDAAKLLPEKNSVFHRLGQKCDVSSTSADLVEDRKPTKSDLRDSLLRTSIVTSTPRNIISRKVKVSKNEDSDLSVPLCVKSTYSEGILACNGNTRKLSLRERMGLPKSVSNFKLRSDGEFRKETQIRRVSDGYFTREKVSSKKRVSFGTVSQKLIPSREEAIRDGELPSSVEERTSVFDRLGFNRTY